MKLSLNIIKFRKGYKWRVFDGNNQVCQSTDYYPSETAASAAALKYFCQAWEVECG